VSTLDALYYPFSRCLEISQMKQMLLLFDSISFVDPVEDEYWRSKLIRDIEPEHNGFKAYRNLSDCLPWLRKDGIVKIVDPQLLHTINNPLTTAATLSDLSDVNWKHAANPVKFSLPTQYFGNNQLPCWNIFSQKIPSAIAELLRTEKTLSKHLLDDGGEEYAWSVSYEAGSAISINVHLLAADELGLALVTDSRLHHELMLMKLSRNTESLPSSIRLVSYADRVAKHAVVQVLGQILPKQNLEHLSLEDIIRFRDDTANLRHELFDEIRANILSEIDPNNPDEYFQVENNLVQTLLKSAKTYSDEIAAKRDHLWPTLMGSMTGSLPASASTAGLMASYIFGSGYVLAASIILAALQPLTATLDWRADLKKLNRKAPSSVAYLTQVSSLNRG